ncbi:hypothetical protein Tco_1128242 [Tanacetum coccineum]
MADNRTMAQLLEAPTEGYEDAIVIPQITANNFKIKHGLLNLVQNKQFFRNDKEDPHAHIRYFNKITSMKIPKNEITRFQQKFDETFYEAWDRFNDLLRGCPHHGFSELHQLDTFYNALNSIDQDSLNSAADFFRVLLLRTRLGVTFISLNIGISQESLEWSVVGWSVVSLSSARSSMLTNSDSACHPTITLASFSHPTQESASLLSMPEALQVQSPSKSFRHHSDSACIWFSKGVSQSEHVYHRGASV